MDERHAIIEIGTRGIRLLVADIAEGQIFNVKYSTGDLSHLGQEADEAGNLSPDSIFRVTNITRRYQQIAIEREADHIYAIATEVVREAPNKEDLIMALAPMVQLRILSAEEESLCSYLACAAAFRHKISPEMNILTIDQGGGSSEITTGRINSDGVYIMDGFGQLDLGTVTLSRLLASASDLRSGYKEVENQVQQALATMPHFPALKEKAPDLTIGMGSSIMVLMQLIFRQKTGSRPKLHTLHGVSLEATAITATMQSIEPILRQYSTVGSAVAPDSDLLPLLSGISTFHAILSQYEADSLTINRQGLRYGALLWLAQVPYKITPSSADDGVTDSRLDINSATTAELIQLPRISSKGAQAIISYRQEHGPFTSVAELARVKGIGKKTVEVVSELVTIR